MEDREEVYIWVFGVVGGSDAEERLDPNGRELSCELHKVFDVVDVVDFLQQVAHGAGSERFDTFFVHEGVP